VRHSIVLCSSQWHLTQQHTHIQDALLSFHCKTVMRTRHNIALYVHCLPCSVVTLHSQCVYCELWTESSIHFGWILRPKNSVHASKHCCSSCRQNCCAEYRVFLDYRSYVICFFATVLLYVRRKGSRQFRTQQKKMVQRSMLWSEQ
jgi:hypothetical protein